MTRRSKRYGLNHLKDLLSSEMVPNGQFIRARMLQRDALSCRWWHAMLVRADGVFMLQALAHGRSDEADGAEGTRWRTGRI